MGSEAARISRLARVLPRMETEEHFANSCLQIEELLDVPENRKYVVRSFNCLIKPWETTLKYISGVKWMQAGTRRFAHLLAKVSNCMENNRLFEWLFELLEKRGSGNRSNDLIATVRDVTLEMIPHLNRKSTSSLTSSVHEVLVREHVETSEAFKVLCIIFTSSVIRDSDYDSTIFQDFVDVVIGWMVDEDQQENTYLFCADILHRVEPLFRNEVPFITNLLIQILDDMEDAIKAFQSTKNSVKFKRLALLIKAYSTMASPNCDFDSSFKETATERFMGSILKSLSVTGPQTKLLHRTKCIIIKYTADMMSYVNIVDAKSLRLFIKELLLQCRKDLELQKCSSLIIMDVCTALPSWIETVASQPNFDDSTLELFDLVMEFIDSIMFLDFGDGMMKIQSVQALLRTRNVTVLQKVYNWLVNKCAISSVEPFINPNKETIMFVVVCLMDIASNKTNLILTRWALNPPIFDLLMELFKYSDDSEIRFSILHVLKSHCFAHSHFVSSVASKAFSADSPGSRFIPQLMKFWNDLLRNETPPFISWTNWILEWIIEFIKASASYSTLLVDFCNDFYIQLFDTMSVRQKLFPVFADLLYAIVTEPHYENTVYLLARDTTLQILLKFKDMDVETKSKFIKVLNSLKEAIIMESDFNDTLSSPSVNSLNQTQQGVSKYKRSLLCSSVDNPVILMSTHEFNAFVLALMTFDPHQRKSDDHEVVTYSPKAIKDAVEILIRSKLKTSLGKPTEFFGHLQMMFKKYRISKFGQDIPSWKLDFVYELDKKVNLGISESLLIQLEVAESLRSFYNTNRHPCIEWLKRLRCDVIEVALQAKYYEMSFLFASLSADDSKIKRASFALKDSDTLKAMNEFALQHFLSGNFEESLKLFEQIGRARNDSGDGQGNNTRDITTNRILEILSNTASTALQDWKAETKEIEEVVVSLKDVNLDESSVPSIVSKVSSDTNMYNDVLSDTDSLGVNKTSFLIIDNQRKSLSLSSILKLSDWINSDKTVPAEVCDRVELLKVTKLLELGNFTFVRNWLARRDIFLSFDNVPNVSNMPLEIVKVAGDLLFAEGFLDKSARVYSAAIDELDVSKKDELASVKLKCLLSFAEKLEFDNFFEIALQSSTLLQLASTNNYSANKDSILKAVFEKGVTIDTENEKLWFSYGNFVWKLRETEQKQGCDWDIITNLSHQALNCFSKFLSVYGCIDMHSPFPRASSSVVGVNREKSPRLVITMIRILNLIKEGYDFDPQQMFLRDEWLKILPDLLPIKKLQPALFQRFPHQVAFNLAATQSTNGVNMIKKRVVGRKGVFDSSCYAFTDVDERFHVSDGVENSLNFDVGPACDAGVMESPSENLNLPEDVLMIVRELQRIGSSRQEQWVAAYQRIHPDWIRRISALRKDMARESNAELIQVYIQPVLMYYEKLWDESLKCETKADLKFVSLYKSSIKRLLKNFRTKCESVDDAVQNYFQLSELITEFDSIENYKISLISLSPALAKFNFKSSASSVTLPGLPSHVTVRHIDPTVSILATKTKPKKLTFRGSDGKLYAYLVKGNENLNIDAGVMEFMKVTEHIIDWSTRNYSVTPLGKRGGLIQIVNNTMPLFQLYKKFLVKHHDVERTTDLFWKRLRTLGHTDRSNQAAVKQVFDELLNETPSDLLAKELQLVCPDPKSWYNSATTFTHDCALGSAIGYILGIGDRHLDNILVDIKNGYFVHVDFSIVFGKGASLRIPETVPFRLTQNICRALKYPRTTGSFKILLEKNMIRFQEFEELALFCVNNVAVASQCVGEDTPIEPVQILESELQAAATILKHRLSCFMPTIEQTRRDTKVLCKKWYKTNEELGKSEENLQICRSYLESLTEAMSILQGTQLDAVNLRELRKRCSATFADTEQSLTDIIFLRHSEGENVKLDENFVELDDQHWSRLVEKSLSQEMKQELTRSFLLNDEIRTLSNRKQSLMPNIIKKLQRWQRILANFHHSIMFIYKYSKGTQNIRMFKHAVEVDWKPAMQNYWSHANLEDLVSREADLPAALESTDQILQALVDCLEDCIPLVPNESLVIESSSDFCMNNATVDGLVKFSKDRIDTFNPKVSVDLLIAEATKPEILAQMCKIPSLNSFNLLTMKDGVHGYKSLPKILVSLFRHP